MKTNLQSSSWGQGEPLRLGSRFAPIFLSLLLTAAAPAARAQSVFIPEGNAQVALEDVLGSPGGIAVDGDGHVYVADSLNHVIRKYLPDGSPATVIGQIDRAGRVDGTAAQARFNLPGRLCYDGAGGILVIDNSTYVRRVDVATLTVSTVVNLAGGVDGTHAYDVTLGTFQNSGTLANLRVGGIAVQSPGVCFVSAANALGVTQYLLRWANGSLEAIATSRTPVASSASAGTRGVAVDPAGNVFMPFPVLLISGATAEYIFRFPAGGVTGVTRHVTPLGIVTAMNAGRTGRLYCFTALNPAVQVFSSVVSNTSLGALTVAFTYPACALSQQAADVAVTLSGDLLAANYRSYDAACGLCTPYGKVDRFAAADSPIGVAAGDLVPPTVTLAAPANGITLNSPTPLSATASDNSGAVQVQFRVNDRDYGPLLKSAPFTLNLNPTNLPAGNLILYAIARDAAGNSTTSGRVVVRNRVGWPNWDGEVLVGDATLGQPVGVAVDHAGDVFVGDQTRLLRFSPLGELRQTYGALTAGVVDGDSVTARFDTLRGLGTDSAGRIVAMDDSNYGGCFLRRLDPASGLTTTVSQLDAQTNAFQLADAYNVTDGQVYPNGGPDGLWGWMDGRDVAGTPAGGLAVSLGNLLGWDFFNPLFPYHFLARLGPDSNTLLAYTLNFTFPDSNPRAVAVAADGTIFASFQTDYIFKKDSLFALAPQFPAGGLNAVQELYPQLAEVDHLAVDAAKRVYVPCAMASTNPARVVAVSGTQAGVPLFSLQHHLLRQPRDVAIDAEGNVYVVSTESRYWDGQFRPVANVVRYARVARSLPEGTAPPHLAPQLCQVRPGAGFQLGFETAPGFAYEIQAAETLAGGFRPVGTIRAAGTQAVWWDTGFGSGTHPASVPQRFYRIRCLGADLLPP